MREPRHVFALLALVNNRWNSKKGADSWLFGLIDWLHRERNVQIESNRRCLTEFIRSYPPPDCAEKRPVALLFLIRGQLILHNVHHLAIARGLAELGYRIKLVVCGGHVERCGVGQIREPLDIPPVACCSCRKSLTPLNDSGYEIIQLVPVPNEERNTANQSDSGWDLETRKKLVYPTLLRHLQGDIRASQGRSSEEEAVLQSLERYVLRVRKLFEEENPSVIVIFNGLFFPECAIAHEADTRGIKVLYHERGVRPNTLFLSRGSAACHYRSEELWATFRGNSTAQQRDIAREFVSSRRTKNVDPLGQTRSLDDSANSARYETLASVPFVVFFAPVIHDTASMFKDAGLGESYQAIEHLCEATLQTGQRLVVRVHPDELRPHNPSRYPLKQFLRERKLVDRPNIVVLDSTESWNPYELAERSSHVVIYNGTMAMECAVLGLPVINLANSHYSRKGFTQDVGSLEDLKACLETPRKLLDEQSRETAAEYLYHYLHRATLDTDQLVRERVGFVCEPVRSSDSANQLEMIRNRLSNLLHNA